ncbi:MAG: hypothetical protein AAFY73_11375, partial [Pseudomonadota bacterium]
MDCLRHVLAPVVMALLLVVPAHAQQTGLESLLEDLFGAPPQNAPNRSEQLGPGRSDGGLILRSPTDQNGVPTLQPNARSERLPDKSGSFARNDRTREVPTTREQINLSFAPLVAATSDSVVNIFADRMVRERSPFADDPFFERFFNRGPGGRLRQQNSLGSGVIVDADGTIITNNHV